VISTLSMPYSPVVFEVGGWQIRWYGLLFALGLAVVWALMRLSASRRGDVSVDDIDRVMFWISIGAVLGGRIGEIILFAPDQYFVDPKRMLLITSGGMSFHGGLLGVALAVVLYHLSSGVDLWRLADLAASAAPGGLLFGRLGNFLNGELYGPETTVPWGVVFPLAGGGARHPTQLYEMLAEGALLFFFLYPLARHQIFINRPGIIFGLFLISYAIVRIAIDPFRLDGWSFTLWGTRLSAGQMYCMPMIVIGVLIIGKRLRAAIRRRRPIGE
jgi:phosphatidylglycerol---prolipoprotein diacylglyceryl transferase